MKAKSIAIIGMKHSGKSTLADMLAWEVKTRNLDLDALIEEEYRSDGLVSCREIYSQHGKEYFEKLECRAAKALAKEMQKDFLIASLGGGTIENECAFEALAKIATFVYIVVDIDILYKRIMKGGLPAFLSPDHPYEDFTDLYNRRSPLMSEKADIIVELQNDPIEDSYGKLAETLKEHGYAW